MPYLEITQAALDPQHARATCEYLMGIMLWPSDAERRAAFLKTAAAVRLVEEVEAVPGTQRPDMLRQTLGVTAPRDFAAEVNRRWLEGAAVGEYYGIAFQRDLLHLPVSLKELTSVQTRSERRKLHPAADFGSSKLRDHLREYRPAAHLWASLYMRHADGIDCALPCSLDQIDQFLSLATTIAARLGTIKLERQSRPMIGPGVDLWRVPDGIWGRTAYYTADASVLPAGAERMSILQLDKALRALPG